MPLKIPKTDEGALNMTPMIDIVFQLILFFLFNLRFKSLDFRIETALPRDRGLAATPEIKQDIPSIKITLFRENAGQNNAYTKMRIAGGPMIEMPVIEWKHTRKDDLATETMLDEKYKPIQAQIAALFRANPELKGEIECPPPKGGAVPHVDVIRVLDCFLGAGVKEVNFVGQAFPLPKKQGGSQN